MKKDRLNKLMRLSVEQKLLNAVIKVYTSYNIVKVLYEYIGR